LLDALRDGEASVQEMADRPDLRHQKASHHLGLHRQAGVVSRRCEGAASFYSIADWTLLWVVDQLADDLVDNE
jgi:DNA-binding transcriptional ArsR family regulator